MRIGGCFLHKSPHWSTPADLYSALNTEFGFDLDPCPLNTAPQVDGLSLDWTERRVFCNPPYGRGIIDWIRKGLTADIAVFLLPARTDTEWFRVCLDSAAEIRFIRGRLKFGESKNSAPFPSIIVVFRKPSAPDKCARCGKPESDSKHIRYGNDIDNPVKHEFEPAKSEG